MNFISTDASASLSDKEIVEILSNRGIPIARRIVALREGVLYVRVLQPSLHYELNASLRPKFCAS